MPTKIQMIEDFVGGITTQTMVLSWDAEANGVKVVEAWRVSESEVHPD